MVLMAAPQITSISTSRDTDDRPGVNSPTIAHIGTFPPTKCGLATFGDALISSMRSVVDGIDIGVVDVVDTGRRLPFGASVQLRNDDRSTIPLVADFVNEFDVVLLEHEFGIYGGPDGSDVLALLHGVAAPVISVLHTVPAQPTPSQKSVLEELARRSEAVVVMSRAASRRLIETYDVNPLMVFDIPHGTHVLPNASAYRGRCDRPTVMTWGLLGPGKGIEVGIDAMTGLRDLIPTPRYMVVGETHPKVLAQSGQSYRHELMERAERAGVAHMVEFDDRYRNVAELCELIRSADVVLIPYDSREQVTSGVLVEAIAAGRPVVATAFPHASEMLGTGAGLVVPHGDSSTMTRALRQVLTDETCASSMRAEAGRLATRLSWSHVAGRYLELADVVSLTSGAGRGDQRLMKAE